MIDPLLKQKEVAKFFSVHRNTIRNWINAGHFPEPETVAPGLKRYRLSAVEKYLSEIAGEAK